MTLNRSFLFAPGNVARRVEKALTLEADAIIVDLEDSVALAEKAATRKSVAEALMRPRRGRGYVRVNAPSSEFCYRDLVETLHRQVDGVVVPKIESAADLHAVDWLMANLEREFGVEPGTLDLIPQIETAAGVQRVDRILQARSLRPYKGAWRVKRVAFGGADYAHQLGLNVGMDEAELADARARVVLSSRAAGLEGPLDSPWFHFREADGFARALERSRRSGFQGRLCVHPDQLAPVNAAYLPSAAELARAERIVAAFRDAEARGEAAVQVDGEMIDYPVAYRAQALIDSVRKAR
jgi:citrate lyase subunit beta / citryl-CoA lyase